MQEVLDCMIGITSGRKFKRGIYTGESIKKRWVLGVVHTYSYDENHVIEAPYFEAKSKI